MYVDEMWLECMQGRAMQDVLAAKQRKKRPPRRPLGEITNRPATPIAVGRPVCKLGGATRDKYFDLEHVFYPEFKR